MILFWGRESFRCYDADEKENIAWVLYAQKSSYIVFSDYATPKIFVLQTFLIYNIKQQGPVLIQ